MLLMSVYDVLDRLRRELLVIDPEIGGRIGKWPEEQRSRLIESLIVGIPLPAFYFDANSSGTWDRWIVVDGFRRLMALRSFVGAEGGAGFRLCGLEYLKEFEGCRFVDLPKATQRRILEANLQVAVICPGAPKEMCFDIVKRVNVRGVSLSGQEIRHLLYNGRGTQFVAGLAKHPAYRALLGRRHESERMLDRELVTRFLALVVLDPEESYISLDSFLNDAMRILNTMDDYRLEKLATRFGLAVERVAGLFGSNVFKRYVPKEDRFRPQLNKALFASISFVLSELDSRAFDRMRFDSAFMDKYKRLFVEKGSCGEFTLARSLMHSAESRAAVLTRLRVLRNFMSQYA